MSHIDKNGALRNSKEDLEAFTAYCREKIKLLKNSDAFIEFINLKYDQEFKKGSKNG